MKSTIKILFLNLLFATSLIAQDDEYGIASFYSDLFHGKPTASGELYDKGKLTAAHKTLPFGTLVKVTELEFNKTVQVTITDRGPFISGRIIELSKEAAGRIGLIQKGTARVKVEIIKEKPSPAAIVSEEKPAKPDNYEEPVQKVTPKTEAKPAVATTTQPAKAASPATTKLKVNEKPGKAAATPAKSEKAPAASSSVLVSGAEYTPIGLYEIALKKPEAKGYGVQVAALTSQNALFKKIADLQGDWFSNILVNVEKGKGDAMVYKVILGSFATQGEAKVYQNNLKKNKKIKGFVVDLASFDMADVKK